MYKEDVGLYQIDVIPGADVVRYHKTRQLLRTEVFVRKEGRINLMSTEK